MTDPATTPPTDLGSAILVPATNILLTLVVTLLAPMFLGVCAGDVDLARAAALETITDYRAQNRAGLLAVAQVIAYGLAALGSLSLSMSDDISLSMTLRLRNNANALNRSAEHNRRALKEAPAKATQPITEMAAFDDPAFDEEALIADVLATQNRAAQARDNQARDNQVRDNQIRDNQALDNLPLASAPPAQTEAPLTDERRRSQTLWASAMADVAGEVTASLNSLPPAQRQAASRQIAALTKASNALLSGVHVPVPSLPVPRFPTAI